MKELKVTRTIEEVTGYEADDGRRFKTEEECRKYENSAKYAIYNQFIKLGISEPFSECQIWENYGYGSEEWSLIVVDIKDENDLKIANMFAEMQVPKTSFPDDFRFNSSHIGKRILVGIGSEYDANCYIYGTFDDLVNKFKNDMNKFFNPEDKATA